VTATAAGTLDREVRKRLAGGRKAGSAERETRDLSTGGHEFAADGVRVQTSIIVAATVMAPRPPRKTFQIEQPTGACAWLPRLRELTDTVEQLLGHADERILPGGRGARGPLNRHGQNEPNVPPRLSRV